MTAHVRPLALLAAALLLPMVLVTCSGQRHRIEAEVPPVQHWERWRLARVAEFKQAPGWLDYTASGRLRPGDYLLGGQQAERADIRLPVAGGALGRLLLGEDAARFQSLDGGVQVPIEPALFHVNPGTRLDVGDGQLHLVRTGPLWGWRFRQVGAASAHPFDGFEVYPYDPRWRLRAHWQAYPQAEPVTVLTTIGTPLQLPLLGEVQFTLDGHRHRLRAFGVPEQDRVMILFADRSSGRDTPAGGRLLLPSRPPAGQRWIDLDFNLAEAPACALSPHLVCPLPPTDARLPLVVAAGEKGWSGS